MPTIIEIFDTMECGPAPENAAFAREWLDAHGASFGHFIDGAFTDPEGGPSFETVNPAASSPSSRPWTT